MSKALLELNNIHVLINKQTIVNDLSLLVEEGDLIALVGPNGAGKSSLLKSIIGLTKIESGNIKYFDETTILNNQIKKKIGYLYQTLALDKDRTVLDNLILSGQLFGLQKAASKQQTIKWLNKLGLERVSKKKITALSGGEKKLIDLIRCIIHEPKLLILDEPYNELDINYRLKFNTILNKLKEELNCGIILTTHLIDECYDIDKLVILNKGKISLTTSSKDLIESKPQYVLEINANNNDLNFFTSHFGHCHQRGEKYMFWFNDLKETLNKLEEITAPEMNGVNIRKTLLSDIYLERFGRESHATNDSNC